MVWSAVIGAGASLAGSMMSANAAAKQQAAALAEQRYQFEQQMGLQNANLALAYNAEQERKAENSYLREQERINRVIKQQEEAQRRKDYEAFQEERRQERQYAIERQLEVDKAAARQREFQLSELLKNQDLSAQERQEALDLLAEAKAVAAGERDEDRRQYLTTVAQKQEERDYLLQQFQNTQATAQQERDFAIAQRDAILANIDAMRGGLSAYQQTLQAVPDVPVMSASDIDAEIARRTSEYTADVDRAADKVASVNEANLIRGGMDLSTQGTARRGEVAERLAREYANARNRAYDDALKYIGGRQSTLNTSVKNVLDARQQMLAEQAGVLNAGIDTMARLSPSLTSATDAMRYASLIPSSAYDRALLSANNYRAPVNVASAVYDDLTKYMPSGLGSTLTPPAAASAYGLQSTIFNPASMTIPQSSTYMGNAGTIGNNLMEGANANLTAANAKSADASSAFGGAFKNFANELGETPFGKRIGSSIDNWFDDLFSSSPAQPSTQSAFGWDAEGFTYGT